MFGILGNILLIVVSLVSVVFLLVLSYNAYVYFYKDSNVKSLIFMLFYYQKKFTGESFLWFDTSSRRLTYDKIKEFAEEFSRTGITTVNKQVRRLFEESKSSDLAKLIAIKVILDDDLDIIRYYRRLGPEEKKMEKLIINYKYKRIDEEYTPDSLEETILFEDVKDIFKKLYRFSNLFLLSRHLYDQA